MLFAIGVLSVVLAAIGLLLPLMPTTPFLLLAAACFSRSSERMHDWLLRNRIFGPILRHWENGGVITLPIKVLATFMMVALISYPLVYLPIARAAKIAAAASVALVLGFIWSRPSTPRG